MNQHDINANKVTRIRECIRHWTGDCNESDELFSDSMMTYCVRTDLIRIQTPDDFIKVLASIELLILFLEKNWLRCAALVMSVGKFSWGDYRLTDALLSNMKTDKEVSRFEFEEFIKGLKTYDGHFRGSYNDIYDSFWWGLISSFQYTISHNKSHGQYDTNMKDDRGRTALFHEFVRLDESYESLNKFIDCYNFVGADLNTIDNHKNTLMHAAAMGRNYPCTHGLGILHEFNPHMLFAQNDDGDTPLHIALKKGNHVVAVGMIKTFFYGSHIGSGLPPHTKQFDNYINTKNNNNRSALEMIMKPWVFEKPDPLLGSPGHGDPDRLVPLVMSAGLLIFCGAHVSRTVAIWLESLAKKNPDWDVLNKVAARAMSRQIRYPDGDFQTSVERAVMGDISRFVNV
jgi:hypothetical protein